MNEAHVGVGHARNAGESLASIINAVAQVESLVKEIAQSTGLQKSVARDVHGNVIAIEEFNTLTLNDSAEGIKLAANLVNDANRLDDSVKAFHL
jgi:methyl-accepting chemotaxis protein